jgi:hypothetical protein
VHDAVNWEIHAEDLDYALPIIRDTMENLPLQELFACDIDVLIIADCKVGTRWGQAKEVPAELLTWTESDNVALTEWLDSNVRVSNAR